MFIKIAVVSTLLAAALLCGDPVSAADAPKNVRLLMTWFAQADQGGFWQAQLDDLGKDDGIKLVVLQGAPKIQTVPQVASGQAEFGVANADDILIARSKGVPIQAVFASLDYTPYSLLYHPDPNVHTLADLNGRTFAVSLGIANWEWAKKRFKIDKAREIPVTGDLSMFKLDQNLVQQGYFIYLPYRMDKAGIPNAQFKIPDLGYRPYTVLFTTDELVQKQPKLVRATVAAAKKGWQDFVGGSPKVKPYVTGLNNQIEPDIHDLAVKDIVDHLVPKDRSQIGCMTDSRWKELNGQLTELSLLPANFDYRPAANLDMVAGCS